MLFRMGAGSAAARLSTLEDSFEAVRASRYNPAYHGIAMIEGLTTYGHASKAKALLDTLVADMNQKGQLLYMPEYLRLEGDILATKGDEVKEEAKSAYQLAVRLARAQSALAWELRATTSLARFYRDRDLDEAETILRPVYQRYTEGLETVDVVAAKLLLDELKSKRIGCD